MVTESILTNDGPNRSNTVYHHVNDLDLEFVHIRKHAKYHGCCNKTSFWIQSPIMPKAVSATWSSDNAFTSEAGGPRFEFWAEAEILVKLHAVLLMTRQRSNISSKEAVLCANAVTQRWVPPTRQGRRQKVTNGFEPRRGKFHLKRVNPIPVVYNS